MVDIWGALIPTIPQNVFIGVLLIVVGVLIASFLPGEGKKYGGILFAVGLVLSVGFELIGSWWQNDVFKAFMIGIGALVMIVAILFSPKISEVGGKK